jgi:hypothetical protein
LTHFDGHFDRFCGHNPVSSLPDYKLLHDTRYSTLKTC